MHLNCAPCPESVFKSENTRHSSCSFEGMFEESRQVKEDLKPVSYHRVGKILEDMGKKFHKIADRSKPLGYALLGRSRSYAVADALSSFLKESIHFLTFAFQRDGTCSVSLMSTCSIRSCPCFSFMSGDFRVLCKASGFSARVARQLGKARRISSMEIYQSNRLSIEGSVGTEATLSLSLLFLR